MDWISIKKLNDKVFSIQFEGMFIPAIALREEGESLEDLIERTRKKFSAREPGREGEQSANSAPTK